MYLDINILVMDINILMLSGTVYISGVKFNLLFFISVK